MAFTIPSTKSEATDILARFEAKINQSAPLTDKAFLRVMSGVLATLTTGLYKFAANRVKQNLVLTADFDDLLILGDEYGVPYKDAVASNLRFNFNATPASGATITQGSVITGDSNGVRYTADASASESGGVVVVNVTAETAGVIGNLNIGDTGVLEQSVSGIDRLGAVTAVNTTGTDAEEVEIYRQRVLFEIRTVGGGGNAVDYKRWSEEVDGVRRAFPYAGNPEDEESSVPPERTVYIEAQVALDPDGIPTSALLDDVRDSITTNPDTGWARQPLGMVDSTLYVEPITRTAFDVNIPGLVVDPLKESDAKAEMDSDLDVYFRSILPYVDGVDVEEERNDTITKVSVSSAVQGVLTKYGATAQGVTVTVGALEIIEYLLSRGEMAKLGTITY